MAAICRRRGRAVKVVTALLVAVIWVYLMLTAVKDRHLVQGQSENNSEGRSSSLLLRPAQSIGSPAVRIFSTDHHNCTYLLPFRLSDGSLSQICTYNPDYDYISEHIKVNKGFESDLVEDVLRALRAVQKLLWTKTLLGHEKAKVSLVDLGSNVGVFTLTAASAGYEVLAVDPMKESLQLLDTSLHLAGLTSRVTILNNAISDVRGSVSMHVDKNNVGGSFVKQVVGSSQNYRGESNIQAICMDDLIPYVRSRHVVVKMDIEGFEEMALRSAGEFFDKINVYAVLVEWIVHRSDSGLSIIEFLTKRGLMPYTDSTKTQPLNTHCHKCWGKNNVMFMK